MKGRFKLVLSSVNPREPGNPQFFWLCCHTTPLPHMHKMMTPKQGALSAQVSPICALFFLVPKSFQVPAMLLAGTLIGHWEVRNLVSLDTKIKLKKMYFSPSLDSR